jgi:hypothetical protein
VEADKIMAQKISEFLADPKKWTQRAVARDAEGNSVSSHDKSAVCWCLLGAARYLGGGSDALWGQVWAKFDLNVFPSSARLNPGVFNDTHTHAEVIAKLKELDL